jgi:hypothetical protein
MKALLALLGLVACSSSDPVPDTCEVVLAGDSFDGPDGSTVTIVMTNPAPPARFTNWWAVTVNTPDGAPMIDPAVRDAMPQLTLASTVLEWRRERDGYGCVP